MAPFALPNSLFRPGRPAVAAQQREREALERIITVVSGSISAGDRTSAMLEIEHALECSHRSAGGAPKAGPHRHERPAFDVPDSADGRDAFEVNEWGDA